MINADDIQLAGRGDLPALRRMRDHWFDLATGATNSPLLPRDEAIAQFELLAELAVGSCEAEDQLGLIVAYQVRIASLERHLVASEDLGRMAREADNSEDAQRWDASVVQFEERLGFYHGKVDSLLAQAFGNEDVSCAAMMMAALSLEANGGDERAATTLQEIIESMPAERASVITSKARQYEKEAVECL